MSKKSKLDSKTIARLFDRFSIIWGQKWDRQVEKNPELLADEWSEALAGLSHQAIKHGLTKTRQTLMWPPTIAEFLQACQGVEINSESSFKCVVNNCQEVGSMSGCTKGNGWVCAKHWAEGK